jgi:transcriptional regulator with PAS, ATPase and Fis domain
MSNQYYFEAAFEVLTDHVSIIGADRNILKVNKQICKDYGKSDGAIRGHKCYKTFFDSSKPCEGCPLEKVKRTKKTITTEIGKDYLLTLSPVFNGVPEPIGYVHILKDLREIEENKRKIRIGEILVNDGKITLDELQDALKIREKKIGEILVERGKIKNAELLTTLNKQKELNGQ